MGVGGGPEVQKIMDAYAEMIPEVDDNWPAKDVGLVVVVDQVRRFCGSAVRRACRIRQPRPD